MEMESDKDKQPTEETLVPLKITAGLYEGKVAIHLDRAVNAIILTANEAIDLGNSLKKLARKVARKGISHARQARCMAAQRGNHGRQ